VTLGVLNHASDQCFESFLLRDLAKLRNVCFPSAIPTKMSDTVLLFMLKLELANHGETQEEVKTCRMQHNVSEWLVS